MEAKRYFIRSFGCKANFSDAQMLEAGLIEAGLRPMEAEAPDVCIVNSCSVTDESDRQSYREARKLRSRYPKAKVIFTGCSAQTDPKRARREVPGSLLVNNQDKPQLVQLALENQERETRKPYCLGEVAGPAETNSGHAMDREWPSVESFLFEPLQAGTHSRTRAFLKVQEGCNSFCTFCIIPYGRGPARSLPLERAIEVIDQLVSTGFQEVVLTGTNLGDYLKGAGELGSIEDLVESVLKRTPLKRLRLSSLDPTEVTPRLLALMRDHEELCPSFHISLQSPHTKILKRMKRHYAFEQVEACLRAIDDLRHKRGDVFVGMDVITGFPGETQEDFDWTVKALLNLPWSRLHVFPYSERKETPATRLPGSVPRLERRERANRLKAMSLDRLSDRYRKKMELAAPLHGVLLEGSVRGPDGTHLWTGGHTADYFRVLLRKNSETKNSLVSVLPLQVMTDRASSEAAFIADVAS